MAGGGLDYWPDGPNADWLVGADEAREGVLTVYREAIAASDAIKEAVSLDASPARSEDWWSSAGWRFPDLRSVIMHVMVEIHACRTTGRGP